jgi:hypothetical protein
VIDYQLFRPPFAVAEVGPEGCPSFGRSETGAHFTTRAGASLARDVMRRTVGLCGDVTARFYKRPGFWCAWCDFLPMCLRDERKAAEIFVRLT